MDEIDPPVQLDDPLTEISKVYILALSPTMTPDEFPQVHNFILLWMNQPIFHSHISRNNFLPFPLLSVTNSIFGHISFFPTYQDQSFLPIHTQKKVQTEEMIKNLGIQKWKNVNICGFHSKTISTSWKKTEIMPNFWWPSRRHYSLYPFGNGTGKLAPIHQILIILNSNNNNIRKGI